MHFLPSLLCLTTIAMFHFAAAAASTQYGIDSPWFDRYHSYSDIISWTMDLPQRFPDLVQVKSSIGKSVQGRDIPQIHLRSPRSDDHSASRRRIWLQSLQHAREWISGSTVQYIVEALLSGYTEGNVRIQRLLDSGMEFIIVPVMNPDGYEYTHRNDRLWRKNRATINGRQHGVDLNRNWPVHWDDVDDNTNPSGETYRGPFAASEPEVRAMMRSFESYGDIVGAIDYHSYSQQILWPPGYSRVPSADDKAFEQVGKAMAKAIADNSGAVYDAVRGSKVSFVTGAAKDWWYDAHGAWGLTLELPPLPDARRGFELDPEFIRPVGSDALQATLVFAEFCRENVSSKYQSNQSIRQK